MSETKGNLIGKIDIRPKVVFENGINLKFSVVSGTKGKELLQSQPDYIQNNPVTVTLELEIEDSEKGSIMLSTLEGVKDMLVNSIPPLSEALNAGVLVKFRHVGKSIFIDISLEGMYAEMVKSQLENFKIDISSFSESGDFHLISGIKLNNPLETSFEDFLKMATLFKVQGDGQLPTKILIENIMKSAEETYSHHIPKNIGMVLKFIRLLSCFKKIEYDSLYDSDDMCTYIKELSGKIAHNTLGGASMDDLNSEIGTQIISSVVAQGQEAAKMQLEGIKQMAAMFLEPYKEQLLEVNFDKIAIGFTIPNYGTNLVITLSLVGITEFLRANILN